jgi:hypothetical protein
MMFYRSHRTLSNSTYLRVSNLLLVPFFSPSYTSVWNLFYAIILYFPSHKAQVIRRTRNYPSIFPDLMYFDVPVLGCRVTSGDICSKIFSLLEPEILSLEAHELLQNLKKLSSANELLVTRTVVHTGLKIR